MPAVSSPLTPERIEAALRKVAALVQHDPAFAPAFERLEAELAAARRSRRTDVQRRAAVLLQKANGPRRVATCSSDAPAP